MYSSTKSATVRFGPGDGLAMMATGGSTIRSPRFWRHLGPRIRLGFRVRRLELGPLDAGTAPFEGEKTTQGAIPRELEGYGGGVTSSRTGAGA